MSESLQTDTIKSMCKGTRISSLGFSTHWQLSFSLSHFPFLTFSLSGTPTSSPVFSTHWQLSFLRARPSWSLPLPLKGFFQIKFTHFYHSSWILCYCASYVHHLRYQLLWILPQFFFWESWLFEKLSEGVRKYLFTSIHIFASCLWIKKYEA